METYGQKRIVQSLSRWAVRTVSSEADLQRGVANVLAGDGFAFREQVSLDEHSRIDFLEEAGIGIELKVAGSRADVIRQLHRYASFDSVSGLVLVTTRRMHLVDFPVALRGKPLSSVYVAGWM